MYLTCSTQSLINFELVIFKRYQNIFTFYFVSLITFFITINKILSKLTIKNCIDVFTGCVVNLNYFDFLMIKNLVKANLETTISAINIGSI